MKERKIIQNQSTVLLQLRYNDERQLSQQDAANCLGLDRTSYHHLEREGRFLKLPEIFQIAAFYNLNPSELVAMIECGSANIGALPDTERLEVQLETALNTLNYISEI